MKLDNLSRPFTLPVNKSRHGANTGEANEYKDVPYYWGFSSTDDLGVLFARRECL